MSTILRGTGTIIRTGRSENIDSDDIILDESGVVVFSLCGHVQALSPRAWESIRITEVEFAPQLLPTNPAGAAECDTCGDSDVAVASMLPPRCSGCGRGA